MNPLLMLIWWIIIFVTGYDKYMNDAFDVSAFHYLLKPVNEEKFRTVFERALKELSATEERTKKCILVKNSGVQQKVYIRDIYYIESANKKVIIHTSGGILESYGKMEELGQMTGSGFYRCHRCYLVNMEKIASYSADFRTRNSVVRAISMNGRVKKYDKGSRGCYYPIMAG